MSRWEHSGRPRRLEEFYEAHSRHALTSRGLRQQNRLYRGTGGSSAESRKAGFVPAFLDTETGARFLSRHADGRVAPVHILDGLPEDLIVRRSRTGRVTAVKGTLLAGFLREGRFYTREQAAQCLADEDRGGRKTCAPHFEGDLRRFLR